MSRKEYQRQWRSKNKESYLKSSRAYRARNKERINEANKEWNSRHREAIQKTQRAWVDTPKGRAVRLVIAAKVRARKLKVPFNLTAEDVLFPLVLGECEATGILFERTAKARSPFAPSLDRVDPTKGYVKGNVQVVIWALNAMRGTWGDSVLLQVADALKASR